MTCHSHHQAAGLTNGVVVDELMQQTGSDMPDPRLPEDGYPPSDPWATHACLDLPAKRYRVGAKLPCDSLYIASDQRTLFSTQRPSGASPHASAPNVDPPPFTPQALLPSLLDWDPNP